MITRTFLSLLFALFVVIVFTFMNLGLLLYFLFWDHRVFGRHWTGPNGLGPSGFVQALKELVVMPWEGKL